MMVNFVQPEMALDDCDKAAPNEPFRDGNRTFGHGLDGSSPQGHQWLQHDRDCPQDAIGQMRTGRGLEGHGHWYGHLNQPGEYMGEPLGGYMGGCASGDWNSMGPYTKGRNMGGCVSGNLVSCMGGQPFSQTGPIGGHADNFTSVPMVGDIGGCMGCCMGSPMGGRMGGMMGGQMAPMGVPLDNLMGVSMGSHIGDPMNSSVGGLVSSSMGSLMGNSIGSTMGGGLLHASGLPLPGGHGAVRRFEPHGLSQAQIEQELEMMISTFGLDSAANEALHRVPLPIADEIIRSLDTGVRNPSAFVMSKLRHLQDIGGLGGARGAGPHRHGGSPVGGMALQREDSSTRCKALLDSYGCDERARRIAFEIPIEALVDILAQLENNPEVRNPSAFIFQSCVNHQKQNPQWSPPGGGLLTRDVNHSPGPRGGFETQDHSSVGAGACFFADSSVLALQAEELVKQFNIDERASVALRAVPLEKALEILGELQRKWDQVRNPSAYVFNAAVKLQDKTTQPKTAQPKTAQHVPNKDNVLVMGRSARGFDFQSMSEHAENLARDLGVDEGTLAALQTVPLEDAVRILSQLRDSRSTVRHPSAFVMGAIQELRQQLGMVGGTLLGQGCGPGFPNDSVGQRLEDAVMRLKLDKAATDALHELPPEEALRLVAKVDAGVRNPSAWVTNAVRNAMLQSGGKPETCRRSRSRSRSRNRI